MSECTCDNCDECHLRLMECLCADSDGEEEEAADVPATASPADAPVAAPAVAPGTVETPTAAPGVADAPAVAAAVAPTSHPQSATAAAAPAGACVVSRRVERSTTGFSRCS
jgi:hypothetical protein